MKKKNNWLFKIFILLFLIYIGFNIAVESGYYEANNRKNSYVTQEKLEEFEEDVRLGKEIDIKNYVDNDFVDYSSATSRIASKIGLKIDKLMEGEISDFFNSILSLFR